MKKIIIIKPKKISDDMALMIRKSTENYEVDYIHEWSKDLDLKNRKILFCLDLDVTGHCIDLIHFLNNTKTNGGDSPFKGSNAVVFVRSPEEIYTKRASQDLINIANSLGCRFLGHSVIETIEELKNFRTWQISIHKSLEEIRNDLCIEQVQRLIKFNNKSIVNKKVLVLHASSHKTSNTLMLWELIQKNLIECDINVFHVENGSIIDCKGCDFKTCNHYSKQKSCFYGGTVIKEIIPAIEEAEIIVWICPNYNDAISANLTALINRLTALYRRSNFYDKRIFAVIVSGNSGSDSVANQLIGALNINKGFQLPPNFAIMEIANDPGSIMEVKDIEEKAKKMAEQINKEIKQT